MKKKFIPLTLAFLFIINVTGLAALAYNRWMRSPEPYLPEATLLTPEALQEPIALNQEQVQQMKSLRSDLENNITSLREQMQEKRQRLIQEARQSHPDLAAIDQVIDEISGLQANIQKKTIRNLMRDKQLLNPAQQSRYFSLFENRVRSMARGSGRRVRGRGGQGRQRIY